MTTEFFHGVQGFVTKIDGRPVRAIRSSVIGVVVTAGKGPVNVPTLIFGNLSEAYTKFGPFLADGFTAGMAFTGFFKQIGTLVVAVNVCDPAVHNTAVASETISLASLTNKASAAHRYFVGDPTLTSFAASVTLDADSEWTVPAGITITGVKNAKGGSALTQGSASGNYNVTDGVLTVVGASNANKAFWITYTSTAAKGVDYTVESDLGQITRVNTSSKILRGSDITIGYSFVDPSKVTSVDVIGAPADGDTPATGLYALRAAATMAGITTKAKLILAPGFSHELSVGMALNDTARVLNARPFLDADNTTYESALAYAENFAAETSRVSVHYPDYVVPHPTVPNTFTPCFASIILAGSQARVDKEIGKGDPYVSLSNRPIEWVAGLTRPVDHTIVNLGETSGESLQQFLNSKNVMTSIFENGWRAYGNTQANGEFLCVQRMADYVLESAVMALLWAVDRPISGLALMDQMLTVVRQFLRALEARGALIANPDPEEDNDVWFPPELNSPDQTSQGTVYLNFRMNPPPPLNKLVVTGELTHEFVKRLFQPNT